MKIRQVTYLLLVSLFMIGPESAAFDFITSRGTGFAQTMMLSKSTASELVTVPSGGISDGEIKLDLGINRQFEIKELDEAFVAAAYRRDDLTYSLGLSQFGRGGMYTERTARLTVGYRYDSLTFGGSLSVMQVEVGSDFYENLSAATLGLGVSYRRDKLFGALTLDNITSPRLEDGSEAIEPKLSLYGEVMGRGAYSVTGRLTVQDREKPQLGIGQKISLADISSVFWGISTEPTIYGGGLELFYRQAIFRYATSFHSALGFSHTVSVAYNFGPTKKTGQQSAP